MKILKIFDNFMSNIWYRGYTSNTRDNKFIWLSSSKNHAKSYSEMNSIIYGGIPRLGQYDIDISKYNLLDFSMYDMDEKVNEHDVESFLIDLDIDYDYIDLFYNGDDEISLSVLVNKILIEIMEKCDIFLIKESGIDTILVNKKKYLYD